MPDPSPYRPPEREPGEPRSSRRPASATAGGADPPTIRTGAGTGPEAGSASNRRWSAPPLPEPGDRIDTFELEESIGAGGMGAVYRALDLRLDRQVALKILPPEQAGDAEVVQRFYQEARAAARLDHENIARVYTIGQDAKYHYIAFEYIEGTNIRQRVQEHGVLTVAEAINYTLQIAGALVHAAGRGVVHRDIKPSNIIVTPQGRAKLVDMGLARRFERGQCDDGLTQSGMTLGTFDYISPEQARDPRDVDVRSDLYSLGCTLYHMLTGQPPFPEGTLLQKLLQHQEEPPPDVRALNPAVPADLAAILQKLMAKDRDRRYQSPEQLARDLLILAGALGLRSVSPEGLVWMAAARPPSWERHLVWGVPTLALALVVLALVWWGQGPEPAPTNSNLPPVVVTPPEVVEPAATKTRPPDADKADLATPAVGAVPLVAKPPADAAPRDIMLRAVDDLAAALATAPDGSTITLGDDGPYDLRPGPTDRDAMARLARRDLTIKAGPDARPRLRPARAAGPDPDANDEAGEAALLRFAGGRVVLDGLEFALDPGDPPAGVFAEDVDLTVRRCLFRLGGPAGAARSAAVRLRTTAAPDGRRPAPARVAASHVDGGLVGLLARGPAEIEVVDTTFGPGGPAVWLDNAGAVAPVPARLGLRHVSVLAGTAPVVRLARTAAIVRVDDSVIAAAGDDRAILLATDDPDRLDWLGRGNLYGGVATYLQPTRDLPGTAAVRGFDDWQDGPAGPRELDSAVHSIVWADADPAALLTRKDPGPAFQLLPDDGPTAEPGARRGPFGALLPASDLLLGLLGPERPTGRRSPPAAEPTERPTAREAEPADIDAPTSPMPVAPDRPADVEDVAPGPMPVEPMNEPKPAPMPVEPGFPGREDSPAAGRVEREPEVVAVERPATKDDPPGGVAPRPAEPEPDGPVRTAAQFLDALSRPGTRGGTIRLAADAVLNLPPCEVKGTGTWVIQAERGATRPRLRFRPPTNAGGRTSLIRLRAGSLELRGIDVVLPADQAPSVGRWSAFAVWAGADLKLTRCTVTIESREPRSAVVAVQSSDDELEHGLARPDPAAALVRAASCLLRTGGDLVDVDPGRRLDLEVEDAVIATGGSLVHGHGLARGQVPEPLKLTLRRVTARNAEGLVWLESQPGEPELPTADVVARDSIVATAPDGGPLFRVDAQEPADTPRERIHWQGTAVAYHKINTYRRDQSSQPGSMPVRFDRPAWEVAVFPREVDPVHEDVRFVREWEPGRPPWTITPADVRLADDSPAADTGPDPDLIPSPPR